MPSAVLGVDACRGGWVVVRLGPDGRVDGFFGRSIDEAVGRASDGAEVEAMAIDIPIGLPDGVVRAADRLARSRVGRRSASVFYAPVRPALDCLTYPEANALTWSAAGIGLSAQAYALRTKILEVDRWIRSSVVRTVEAHPELCFATIAGRPLESKKTWAGALDRRRLLESVGIEIPADLGEAGRRAGVDDVLDAAVVAWTARRVADGVATCLPDPPQRFSDGLDAAIWT